MKTLQTKYSIFSRTSRAVFARYCRRFERKVGLPQEISPLEAQITYNLLMEDIFVPTLSTNALGIKILSMYKFYVIFELTNLNLYSIHFHICIVIETLQPSTAIKTDDFVQSRLHTSL